MRTLRVLLVGLGNVGARFVGLLRDRSPLLAAQYGLDIRLVGVADRRGCALAPEGLDPTALCATKAEGRSVAMLPGAGRPGWEALRLLDALEADLLVEASPTNYRDAQPGLDLVRRALASGRHAVLASKGPLVLAWPELAALSDWSDPARPSLRFGGTTCGALPTLAMGRRDLAAARIRRMEGVLNLSTQILLARMAEGVALPQAIAEAQGLGLLEADPSLDVEGWDAAAKLVIVANAVLGMPARLDDVARQGIAALDAAEVAEARRRGARYALLATAVAEGGTYRLQVAPRALPLAHPFAHLEEDEGAVLYETDIYGRMVATLARQGPLGTAAALLRDLIGIARAERP